MHLLQFTPLLHLALHGIAFALLFVSVMGTPGNPDESKPVLKRLMTVWGFLLLVAWKGIPVLALVSLIAFFFHYDMMGRVISYISLTMGFVLFSTLLLYYILQSKYKKSQNKDKNL